MYRWYYNKPSALKNKLGIFDINDKVTDDVINVDDELIENKDYIKRDKIKIAYVSEIAEIPMRKEYDYDFLRSKNYHLAVTNPSALLKQNGNKFWRNMWNYVKTIVTENFSNAPKHLNKYFSWTKSLYQPITLKLQ